MPDVEYSLVRDPGLLKQLDAEENRGEYLTLYRAAQLVDGKLYSPMAAKINGEWPAPIRLEKWEQADEHPELIVKGNKFKLDKGNGSSITAAYNPYIHSSETPLNDQFSSAWKRAELLMKEFHFWNFIVGFIKQIVKIPFQMFETELTLNFQWIISFEAICRAKSKSFISIVFFNQRTVGAFGEDILFIPIAEILCGDP